MHNFLTHWPFFTLQFYGHLQEPSYLTGVSNWTLVHILCCLSKWGLVGLFDNLKHLTETCQKGKQITALYLHQNCKHMKSSWFLISQLNCDVIPNRVVTHSTSFHTVAILSTMQGSAYALQGRIREFWLGGSESGGMGPWPTNQRNFHFEVILFTDSTPFRYTKPRFLGCST